MMFMLLFYIFLEIFEKFLKTLIYNNYIYIRYSFINKLLTKNAGQSWSAYFNRGAMIIGYISTEHKQFQTIYIEKKKYTNYI